MKKKLSCVLLVDDNFDCNFFLKKLLDEQQVTEMVNTALDGEAALAFLNTPVEGKLPSPALIFLDINMPRMNGWEFLEDYDQLDPERKKQTVIIMLTSSINPDDEKRALANPNVKGFYQKFLEEPQLNEILAKFYPESL